MRYPLLRSACRSLCRSVLVLGGSLLLLSACEQKPFQMSFPTNDPGAVGRVARKASRPVPAIRNATGHPMAFIVATRPRGIVALDLSTGKVLWRKNISDVSSKIVVGGDYLFHRKGSTVLMARSLQTGAVLWQQKFKYGNATEFYGLATDGRAVYYVVTTMTGGRMYARFADLVKRDARTGKLIWRRRANGPLGNPAVRNGLVFVPYRFQYLSVLDASTGREVVRTKVVHRVKGRGGVSRMSPVLVNFVRSVPEGLIFGNDHMGAIRFTSAVATGKLRSTEFVGVALKKQRSVNIRYYWDAYKPTMVDYTAIDRNRLLWRFAATGKSFVGDRAVLQYYRYFFGFDASTGTLRWAYMHPATQVISSAYLGKRLVYISREGRIVMLDVATGDRVWELETGIRTHGATFDCDGWSPPAKNREANPPLLTVLKEVIDEPDLQFQDAKVFAVTQLVKLKGAEISRILLRLVNASRTPAQVRRVAGKVLVERASRDSVGILLGALKTRYDYLKGTAPKGVGIIARALGRIRSRKAVPALLSHLQEPMTPYSDLEEIVHALVRIHDKRIVWPFGQFLLTYRGDRAFAPRISILTEIAKAMMRLGGRTERQVLAFVAEDHNTLPQLRQYLRMELGKALK